MGEPGFPSRGRLLLLALAVALAVSFTGIFQRDLWHPDEPRLAEMGRAMAATPGWSAAPMLAGEPFLEQPPLCVWSVAASYEVLGVSPGAARVPMALFGLLLLGVAFLLGERAGGPLAGFLSAAVLATTVRFVSKMHVVIPDVPLTLFVAAGHLAFLAARDQWREGRRPTAFALVGLAAGLAFLSKGPIGPILIAGPALLATAVTDRPFLLRAALWTAAACGAGVALFGVPWVLALARESGREAVRESLLGNSLGRFEGKQVYGHAAPFWYYLPVFPLSLLPWVLAVPALLRSGAASPEREGGRARFLGLLALAGVLLLSIPSSKRAVYVLPLLPAACVPIAAWLADLARRAPTLLERRTLAAILGLPAAAAPHGAPPPGGAAAGGGGAPGRGRAPPPAHPPNPGGRAAPRRPAGGPPPPPPPPPAGAAAAGAASALSGDLELLRSLPPFRWGLAAAGLAAAGLLLGRCALRALRSKGPPEVLAGALALAAAVAVFQGLVEPLEDPIHSMRDGALRAAALFPGNGPIPAMGLSEKTRSVVPFYSGRSLRMLDPDEVAADPVPLLLVDERPRWDAGLVKRGLAAGTEARVPLDPDHFVLVVRPAPR